MAFSSCICVSGISLKMATRHRHDVGFSREIIRSPKSVSAKLLGQQLGRVEFLKDWTSNGGSRIMVRPRIPRCIPNGKGSRIQASWFTGSQVANTGFTLGTAAVLPFYTLMVLAPKTELTKRTMKSSIPYAVLGILYACLLCLSWTTDTIRLMFASQYLLPELPGIAKLFSTETGLASAWIHLMVVDLFAARQVYHDGTENEIETRHSVTLCLLFCPIGILTHVVTKALIQSSRNTKHK